MNHVNDYSQLGKDYKLSGRMCYITFEKSYKIHTCKSLQPGVIKKEADLAVASY